MNLLELAKEIQVRIKRGILLEDIQEELCVDPIIFKNIIACFDHNGNSINALGIKQKFYFS